MYGIPVRLHHSKRITDMFTGAFVRVRRRSCLVCGVCSCRHSGDTSACTLGSTYSFLG
jgi:hypothetical protein